MNENTYKKQNQLELYSLVEQYTGFTQDKKNVVVSSCGCIASGCCLEELNVQKSIGPKIFITIGPQTMSYFLIAMKYPKLFIFLSYLLLLFEQVTAKSNTVAIYPNKLLNINQLYSHINFHWQKIFFS